jgi:hypothetical protein
MADHGFERLLADAGYRARAGVGSAPARAGRGSVVGLRFEGILKNNLQESRSAATKSGKNVYLETANQSRRSMA